MWLSASSRVKGQADREKYALVVLLLVHLSQRAHTSLRYEKARRLCKKIPEIRKKYIKDLDDSDALVRAACVCVMLTCMLLALSPSHTTQVRQRATALWFIDRLALRVGNEKGEDEVCGGCCVHTACHS